MNGNIVKCCNHYAIQMINKSTSLRTVYYSLWIIKKISQFIWCFLRKSSFNSLSMFSTIIKRNIFEIFKSNEYVRPQIDFHSVSLNGYWKIHSFKKKREKRNWTLSKTGRKLNEFVSFVWLIIACQSNGWLPLDKWKNKWIRFYQIFIGFWLIFIAFYEVSHQSFMLRSKKKVDEPGAFQ